MCGIAGYLDLSGNTAPDALRLQTVRMGQSLQHRGPDDGREWTDPEAYVGLAHRRLSIIDLSTAGLQPMASSCGRYVIVYNGEVYNFQDLRAEFEAAGATFRGHSDTEVVLEAFSRDGIVATVPRLLGMFAMAVWDRRERTLTLVRDRLGIKPLYWGRQGDRLYFASEMKAIVADPAFQREINRDALASLVALNYVPGPDSVFSCIRQLAPATILTISSDGKERSEQFWSLTDFACGPRDSISDRDAEEAVHTLLRDSVARRMIADVPLGVFLSGGIDSSTVAALMQSVSSAPIHTLTAGFSHQAFDESSHAAAIAKHLGSHHVHLEVDETAALDTVPKLAEMYCEPFADSSQIPTYLISARARDHVTVVLSGDGGDEVFGGYNRYLVGSHYWPKVRRIPFAARATAGWMMTRSPRTVLDAVLAAVPATRRPSTGSDAFQKIAQLLESGTLDDFYQKVIRFWPPAENPVLGGKDVSLVSREDPRLLPDDPVERMMLRDMQGYLPGDILTKVDRATMAVGLEARVPLIDHRLVEYMWRMPLKMKIRNTETKWLLRRILDRYVPNDLTSRPKAGFAVPLADWLRGPLRDWASELLSTERLADTGLFDARRVQAVWHDHLTGGRNRHYALWSVLMAQSWHAAWINGAHAPSHDSPLRRIDKPSRRAAG